MLSLKKIFYILLLNILASGVSAQMYFPPLNGNSWDTLAPASLSYCDTQIDSLYQLLEANSTKAFILLKDGKIVLEKYFDNHTVNSNWYWASAGKSLTAFLVGLAQQENYLNIQDTSSKYLGTAWTNCSLPQENNIKIIHQLSMTSGLDDLTGDPHCTDDTCLKYLAAPNTRWAYHNAPYTLLDQVIESATGSTLNNYNTLKLKNTIGMNGTYLPNGYNNVYYSTARSMARFGLLMLNKGTWNGTTILSDTNYFNSMVNTSQNYNKSYGYLWWLNGKSSYMIPQSQFTFTGSFIPDAPADMYAAMGKNGQFINVIPSQNMVWIRMGDSPDNSLVPFLFNNEIWQKINKLKCNFPTSVNNNIKTLSLEIYPNPATNFLTVRTDIPISTYQIKDAVGKTLIKDNFSKTINIHSLAKGYYYITFMATNFSTSIPFNVH